MSTSELLKNLGYNSDSLLSEQQPKSTRNTGFLGDTVSQLKVGFQKLPSVATGLLDIVPNLTGFGDDGYDKLTDEIGKATGFQPSKWAEETKQKEYSLPLMQAQQAENQIWQDSDSTGGDIAAFYAMNPRLISAKAVESLLSMLAGGAIGKGLQIAKGVSGAAAAGIGEGAVMAGQAMNDIKSDDAQTKAFTALGIGGIGGLIGTGSGQLANKLGVFDANQLFLKNAAQRAVTKGGVLSNASSMALKSAGIEASEEVAQTYFETGLRNLAEGKPFNTGMSRDLVEAGLAGGAMGFAGGSVSGALTRTASQVSPEINPDETVQTTGQNNLPQWQQPDFKIKPDAQAIVDNQTIQAQGTQAAIDAQYQNYNAYNPLAGAWETPNAVNKPDAQAIVDNQTIQAQGTQAAIDAQYQNDNAYNPLAGIWEKPSATNKPVVKDNLTTESNDSQKSLSPEIVEQTGVAENEAVINDSLDTSSPIENTRLIRDIEINGEQVNAEEFNKQSLLERINFIEANDLKGKVAGDVNPAAASIELFEGLDSRVPKETRDKALVQLESHPDKERISFVQDKFVDILAELDAQEGFEIEC